MQYELATVFIRNLAFKAAENAASEELANILVYQNEVMARLKES